jgi:DNA repair exonuclease SbcCD ATPase subunit
MKFDKLTSFYGEHTFPLSDRGLTLILGDNQDEPRMNSNGSGKSTLLDALDWCLWGDVPRGDHVDSIVHEGEKGAWAKVFLQDDSGKEITILRSRGLKIPKLELRVDGSDSLTALDVAETQASVESLLGMDREVFHATVLFGQQDMWKFADATDKERIDLLTRILQLGQIDAWKEKATHLRSECSGAMEGIRVEAANIEGQVRGLEQIDYDAQIGWWDQQNAEAMANVRRLLESYKDLPDPAAIQTQIDSLRGSIANLPPIDETHVNAAREALSYARSDEGFAKTAAKDATQAVVAMRDAQAGDCSQCGQPITAEHIAKEVASLTEKAQALIAKAGTATEVRKQREADFTKHMEDHNRLVVSERTRREQSELQIQRFCGELGALERKHQDKQTREAELLNLEAQINPHVEEKRHNEEKIKTLTMAVEAREEEMARQSERLKILDFWVTALGAKGLKNYILDTRLQEMTDAANEWVRLLTGGTLWVRFETQTKGRSTGKLSNKLNIRVFRFNPGGGTSERNYRSWSGGEKQRVSLGIDFGLSRLVAARAKNRYDLLILVS